MYQSFYGLKENPFNITPDPSFFFLSRQHQEALSALVYGIKSRKGFMEVTGEIGSGKTTLCRCLLNILDRSVKTALILNPHLSDLQMLRTIVQDFGIIPPPAYSPKANLRDPGPNAGGGITRKGLNKKDLFDALNKFLLDQLALGNNVVLIIDEAQNLKPGLLEQIRILSNLETDKEKLLQIILVGQPELREILSKTELKQLRQRISIRYHLTSLGLEETQAYIQHRLKIAGSQGRLKFTPEAVAVIFTYSKGIPRLINIVCDNALLAGYVAQTFEIQKELVGRSIEEIEGDYRTEDSRLRIEKNILNPQHSSLSTF